MIGDLLFFLKVIFITALVVVLMQIRIGKNTLEERATLWAQDSIVMEPLNQVAAGGVIFIRETWKKLTSGINTKFTKSLNRDQIPGSRTLGIKLERSKQFLKENAQKAAEQAEQWRAELEGDDSVDQLELPPEQAPEGAY